jgi:hypothetical protein
MDGLRSRCDGLWLLRGVEGILDAIAVALSGFTHVGPVKREIIDGVAYPNS